MALLFTGVAPLLNDRGQGPRPLDPLTRLDGRVCRHGRCSFLPACTPPGRVYDSRQKCCSSLVPVHYATQGHSASKISLTAPSACSTPLGSTSGTPARNAPWSKRHWHYSTSQDARPREEKQ